MTEEKTVAELEAEVKELLNKKLQQLQDEEKEKEKKAEEERLAAEKQKHDDELVEKIEKNITEKYGIKAVSKLDDDKTDSNVTDNLLGGEPQSKVFERFSKKIKNKTGQDMEGIGYEEKLMKLEGR